MCDDGKAVPGQPDARHGVAERDARAALDEAARNDAAAVGVKTAEDVTALQAAVRWARGDREKARKSWQAACGVWHFARAELVRFWKA